MEWIMRSRLKVCATILLFALLGCSKTAPRPEQESAAPAQERATFVNRVWRVSQSSSVDPGQLYTFLSEGTLVIASSTGKPSLGTWSQEGDELTIVEESLPYKVDVLALSETEFRIRINGPGEPVTIRFEPAHNEQLHRPVSR